MLLVVAIERVSTMQLLCPGGDNDLNSHRFPQTAPTDEAVNLTSEKHDPCTQISHLHKRGKQKYLVEGTGVEPAKYPPKVKLEIFSQLLSTREGSIMRTLMRGNIGAFIVVRFCLPSL